MERFLSKEDKDFWIACYRHAESKDKDMIEAKWRINDYTTYADNALTEVHKRSDAAKDDTVQMPQLP